MKEAVIGRPIGHELKTLNNRDRVSNIRFFPDTHQLLKLDALNFAGVCKELAMMDSILIYSSGHSVKHVDSLFKKADFAEALRNKVTAYASLDSHHQMADEMRLRPRFTTWFSNISDCAVDLNGYWVWPPFVSRNANYADLNYHMPLISECWFDISFLYHPHTQSDRNDKVRKVIEYLKQREADTRHYHRWLIGSCNVGPQYFDLMSHSLNVLNIPLMSELNLRPFEALACNRPLVTLDTPDYRSVANSLGDEDAFIFYSDLDPERILDAMWTAMRREYVHLSTRKLILEKHQLAHRYVEMLDIMAQH